MAEQAEDGKRRCAFRTCGGRIGETRTVGAVPAAGRHAGPGRPGTPPGGHYGSPARSWLIARLDKSRLESVARERTNAARGAPRGAASARTLMLNGCADRRSTPLTLRKRGGRDEGAARAPLTKR